MSQSHRIDALLNAIEIYADNGETAMTAHVLADMALEETNKLIEQLLEIQKYCVQITLKG